MIKEMFEKIPANYVVIPCIIGAILVNLGVWLHDECKFFKQEWMYDLYLLFTIITTLTVEAFLLGQI